METGTKDDIFGTKDDIFDGAVCRFWNWRNTADYKKLDDADRAEAFLYLDEAAEKLTHAAKHATNIGHAIKALQIVRDSIRRHEVYEEHDKMLIAMLDAIERVIREQAAPLIS